MSYANQVTLVFTGTKRRGQQLAKMSRFANPIDRDIFGLIVELIDEMISDLENESTVASVRGKVNEMMSVFSLFAY